MLVRHYRSKWPGWVARHCHEMSEITRGGPAFNRVFRAAYIRWRGQMEATLRQAPYNNAVKSAWDKVST